jgi:hypothetical protein
MRQWRVRAAGQQQAAQLLGHSHPRAQAARLAKLVLDDGDLELVRRVVQDRVDEGGLPAAEEARHNLWAA